MACFVRLRHLADEDESRARVFDYNESTGMVWLNPQASSDVHEVQLRVKVDKVFVNSSNGVIWDLAIRARLAELESKQLTIVSYGVDMIGEGSRRKMPRALQSLAMERPVWFRGVFASDERAGMFARIVQHLCETVASRRAESHQDVSLEMSIVKASGPKCDDLLPRTCGKPSWRQIVSVDQAMIALRQALDRRMKDESFVVRLSLVEAKRRRLAAMLADVARIDRLSLLRCLAAVATGGFVPSRDTKLAHLLAPHLQTALYFFGLDESSSRAVASDVISFARQAKRALAFSRTVTPRGACRTPLTEHNALENGPGKTLKTEEPADETDDCTQSEFRIAKSQVSQDEKSPAQSHNYGDIVAHYDAVICALQSSLVEREITIRGLQSQLARARKRHFTLRRAGWPDKSVVQGSS